MTGNLFLGYCILVVIPEYLLPGSWWIGPVITLFVIWKTWNERYRGCYGIFAVVKRYKTRCKLWRQQQQPTLIKPNTTVVELSLFNNGSQHGITIQKHILSFLLPGSIPREQLLAMDKKYSQSLVYSWTTRKVHPRWPHYYHFSTLKTMMRMMIIRNQGKWANES